MAKRTCSVAVCDRQVVAFGWCDNHYRRWRRNGDPGVVSADVRVGGPKPAGRTCSLEGCDKPHKGNGYCHTHNELFKRNGSPERLPKRIPATCAVEGCERDELGKKGYCQAHWARIRSNGTAKPDMELRAPQTYEPGTICSIDGCGKLVESRGWCLAHYKKWFRYGDPTVVKAKRVVISDGHKNCTTCDRVLPFSEFFRNSLHASGMDYACKDCMAARRGGDSSIRVAVLRDRDGDHCYLCGRVMSFTPYRIGNYNPRRASIEHVIPRARGGEHTLDNVKLACLRCNIRKNAKILEFS